mgnify:CR=1 FL=1
MMMMPGMRGMPGLGGAALLLGALPALTHLEAECPREKHSELAMYNDKIASLVEALDGGGFQKLKVLAPPNDQVLIYDLELVEVKGESRSRFHSWHVSSHVEL